MENHYIDCINGFNPDILDIFSRDVLQRIKSNDESWETMVPEPVVAAIKTHGLFGYIKSRSLLISHQTLNVGTTICRATPLFLAVP